MRHLSRIPLAILLAAILVSPVGAAADDWPNFRGPNHDGISPETGFVKAWNSPIPLLWEREVGDAFSSFACVGDKVYTCGAENEQQVVFCLKADNGDVVWKTAFEKRYRDAQGGNGTRATPTVDDGRVYVLGGHGRLVCLSADSGKVIWDTKYEHKPTWGYSGSVLIEGDMAIASGGKSHGSLAAYDKKTGKRIWKSGNDQAGYATPYPFTFAGKRYIVGFMAKSVVIVEAASGNEVCRIGWKTSYDVNAADPIYHDGYLFLSSGYRTGCGLFKLNASGGKLTAKEVWRGKVPMNKFQTPILHEGKLYSRDQKALSCVDFMTGKQLWRKLRIKHGTLIAADGHLLLLTERGELQIAPIDPSAFEPVTTAEILSGRCWTVPVLHNGRLYARNLKRVVCFDLTP